MAKMIFEIPDDKLINIVALGADLELAKQVKADINNGKTEFVVKFSNDYDLVKQLIDAGLAFAQAYQLQNNPNYKHR